MKDKSYLRNLEIENNLRTKGYKHIACVDEVGRGCFAGPVVCAAVIMPENVRIPYLTDSKKVPKIQHSQMVEEIKKYALYWSISVIGNETIDEINIREASLKGMLNAVESLPIIPDFCLIDGNAKIDTKIPQLTVVSGDFYSHGISAASLLAKLHRDRLMTEYDKEFSSVYEWANNAGYPTQRHIELTKKYGVTKYHRKTWATMNKILSAED